MKKMTIDETLSHLEKISLPYIKAALEQECRAFFANPKNVKKFQKTAKQVFFDSLRVAKLSPKEISPKARHLTLNVIKDPVLLLNEEQINDVNKITVSVVGSFWMEFLRLVLMGRKDVLLNENLLPLKREDASEEVWKVLENCFVLRQNAPVIAPITLEQWKKITKQFANEFILPQDAVVVKGDILIETVPGEPHTFLARHAL